MNLGNYELSINSSGAHPPPPPSPGQLRGICSHCQQLGGEAFTILSQSWGLGISISRGEPQIFDTHVFERQISLSGRTRLLSKTGLSIREEKNLLIFFKVCFFNFRYFFITCKHVTISDNMNFILFIKK